MDCSHFSTINKQLLERSSFLNLNEGDYHPPFKELTLIGCVEVLLRLPLEQRQRSTRVEQRRIHRQQGVLDLVRDLEIEQSRIHREQGVPDLVRYLDIDQSRIHREQGVLDLCQVTRNRLEEDTQGKGSNLQY